mmetsp:Transcript_1916/g.6104  ORF Transcript_1916/g.6104 Transcript_1916/m.6104 type:complete len:253 (-) Transcript_1916:9-767(-)
MTSRQATLLPRTREDAPRNHSRSDKRHAYRRFPHHKRSRVGENSRRLQRQFGRRRRAEHADKHHSRHNEHCRQHVDHVECLSDECRRNDGVEEQRCGREGRDHLQRGIVQRKEIENGAHQRQHGISDDQRRALARPTTAAAHSVKGHRTGANRSRAFRTRARGRARLVLPRQHRRRCCLRKRRRVVRSITERRDTCALANDVVQLHVGVLDKRHADCSTHRTSHGKSNARGDSHGDDGPTLSYCRRFVELRR